MVHLPPYAAPVVTQAGGSLHYFNAILPVISVEVDARHYTCHLRRTTHSTHFFRFHFPSPHLPSLHAPHAHTSTRAAPSARLPPLCRAWCLPLARAGGKEHKPQLWIAGIPSVLCHALRRAFLRTPLSDARNAGRANAAATRARVPNGGGIRHRRPRWVSCARAGGTATRGHQVKGCHCSERAPRPSGLQAYLLGSLTALRAVRWRSSVTKRSVTILRVLPPPPRLLYSPTLSMPYAPPASLCVNGNGT